eukprot:1158937-Pelagomonas_calceolata.AAC.1
MAGKPQDCSLKSAILPSALHFQLQPCQHQLTLMLPACSLGKPAPRALRSGKRCWEHLCMPASMSTSRRGPTSTRAGACTDPQTEIFCVEPSEPSGKMKDMSSTGSAAEQGPNTDAPESGGRAQPVVHIGTHAIHCWQCCSTRHRTHAWHDRAPESFAKYRRFGDPANAFACNDKLQQAALPSVS